MKIIVYKVPEEGMKIVGDDPPSILDVSKETLYRFEKPIHYEFDVTWVGENSLLIEGKLSTIVKAQCVRSLEWFELPIEVADFKSHQPDLKDDEVDLTEEIREDILILLPANPISPKAKPLEATQPSKLKTGSEAWGKLDKLKLK
jgi:uncharacterized metal-binding protein YceD (DUF177 family)